MSSYLNDLEAQQPQHILKKSCDVCAPVRKTFNAITTQMGKSKFLTSVFIVIPMIMTFAILMYFEYGIQTIYFQGQPYIFEQVRQFFSPPVVLVSTIIFVSGTLSLLSLYFEFQNIIGMCSFIYSAIAYWAIVNTLIIVFCTWNYLNHDTIGYAFLISSLASFLWLFSSAVMDAYRKVMNDT